MRGTLAKLRRRELSRRRFFQHAGLLAASTAGLSTLGCAPGEPEGVEAPTTGFGGYDAMGLSELVRSGEVSPLELVEDVLLKIERVNPQLNAVLTSLFDVEKARARAVGALGESRLSGVPVLLKNLVAYGEAEIDSGSRLMAQALERGLLPRQTSPLVAAMEAGGMIVSGITNTPEFGLTDTTEPVLHGATRNPWNPDFSPGGSSGGTGAAIAAGIVPLAHGNDGGGSIRLPASHNGVFGLKPTRSRELGAAPDVTNVAAISSDLCLSRTVRDTAAFLDLCEDKSRTDLEPVGFVEGPSDRRLRIALMMDGFTGPPHHEVAAGVTATAELCAELGHSVEAIAPPIDGEEFIDAFIGFWASSTVRFPAMAEQWFGGEIPLEELLEPWTFGLMKMANERGPEACVERGIEVFTRASERMAGLFESFDVLLSPTVRTPPFRIGEHSPTGDFDEILPRVLDVVTFTPLQNAVGMPGMSVPLHWTVEGLPVGSHFSAWRGQERRLLELAYELEAARPWKDRRPPISAV